MEDYLLSIDAFCFLLLIFTVTIFFFNLDFYIDEFVSDYLDPLVLTLIDLLEILVYGSLKLISHKLDFLGKGGCAVVWLCLDQKTGNKVACK